ncbi:MAG TPA: carbon storage regulator [Ktedonobacterales bacterium]|nr:carbon storage regulator [Ktedonobacterales bacterium]
MLVLRRKAGEAIVLNGVITIHVLAVEGERVKLGISAPPEVVIVRSELLENQGPGGGPGDSMSGPSPLRRELQRPYREPDTEPRGSTSEQNTPGGLPPRPIPPRYARPRPFQEDTQPPPLGTPPPPFRYR